MANFIKKRETDVLSGGAGNRDHFQSHPGSMYFREILCKVYHPIFVKADEEGKTQIVHEITAAVAARNGRFLTLSFRQEWGLWLWGHVSRDLLYFVIRQTTIEVSGGIDIISPSTRCTNPLSLLSTTSRRSASFVELLDYVQQSRRASSIDSSEDQGGFTYPMLALQHSKSDVKMVSPTHGSDLVEIWIRDIEFRLSMIEHEP